jgi:hypothetical protein
MAGIIEDLECDSCNMPVLLVDYDFHFPQIVTPVLHPKLCYEKVKFPINAIKRDTDDGFSEIVAHCPICNKEISVCTEVPRHVSLGGPEDLYDVTEFCRDLPVSNPKVWGEWNSEERQQ